MPCVLPRAVADHVPLLSSFTAPGDRHGSQGNRHQQIPHGGVQYAGGQLQRPGPPVPRETGRAPGTGHHPQSGQSPGYEAQIPAGLRGGGVATAVDSSVVGWWLKGPDVTNEHARTFWLQFLYMSLDGTVYVYSNTIILVHLQWIWCTVATNVPNQSCKWSIHTTCRDTTVAEQWCVIRQI